MSESNKTAITIHLMPSIVEELKANLKNLQGKQIPFGTTLEQLIELILSNYINSSKAMENMNSNILKELQEKFTAAMSGEPGSTDFYNNLMKNFKNIFDPSQMTENIFGNSETNETNKEEKKELQNQTGDSKKKLD